MVKLQTDPEAPGGGLQDADTFGHDFGSDAVAGDDGNAMGLAHGCAPLVWMFDGLQLKLFQ